MHPERLKQSSANTPTETFFHPNLCPAAWAEVLAPYPAQLLQDVGSPDEVLFAVAYAFRTEIAQTYPHRAV